MELKSPYEIDKGIYWVGSIANCVPLNCNPYLIIDNNEGVLIDPGSVLDFDEVYSSITSLIPIENIRYIILQHQDPDFCSSTPLFEKKGFCGKIATFWRTAVIVKYYGIKSDYYLVNEHDLELVLSSGRKLNFFLTPYLHFPGAIVTYDRESEILFSSDLFGAMSFKNTFNLFADNDYMGSMLSFHEHYMPGNEIIRPVMDMLLKLDIKKIASQHGSIIIDNVHNYIEALRDLECGSLLHPVRKSLKEAGGYSAIVNILLKRCASVFSTDEIISTFQNTEISIEPLTFTIIDYNCLPEKLIDIFFNIIYNKKGFGWISALEIIARKLSAQFSLPTPEIYQSTIFNFEKATQELSLENARLEEANKILEISVADSRNQLEHCPVTGLYNRIFFEQYLSSISQNNQTETGSLLLVKIDRLQFISYTFGNAAANETLKNAAYLLKEIIAVSSVLFKLDGALFACHCPGLSKVNSIELADHIRSEISRSAIFIEPVTVTIGLAAFEEFTGKSSINQELGAWCFAVAEMRLHQGAARGQNFVISDSSLSTERYTEGLVLVADSEPLNLDTLKKLLFEHHIEVITCTDGEQALSIIDTRSPDVVISEVMLPKIDGFMVRERMLQTSSRKNSLFIFTSYVKTEQSIRQALSLDVVHYLKKPYYLTELSGIILHHIQKSKSS